MARAVRARSLVAAAAGIAALAGCSVPSNAPTAYDDDVRQFFLEGCTGDVPETDGTTTTLASSGDCGCAYDVFESMVPYDDDARADERYAGYPEDAPTFKDLDDDVADSEEARTTWAGLPEDVRGALEGCAGGGGADGGDASADTTPATAGEPSEVTTDDTAG